MSSSAARVGRARHTARISGTSSIEVLIVDQQVAIERRVLVAPKAASPRIGFEQAMDRLRLKPGALGQAFRSTAGRRTERDSDGLREKDLEDELTSVVYRRPD